MRKTFLASVLICFALLAVSCNIVTNYPEKSTGKLLVRNDRVSGKTIKHITVTGDPNLVWEVDTYINADVSIVPGSNSQEYSLNIEYSNYLPHWNSFRVIVTMDDASTASVNVRVYEDVVRNLRYNGTTLVLE